LYHDDKPFYNESYFRIGYRYRAIYNGDLENDVRPRVYMDIPSKDCVLYNDEKSPGRNVTMGCPDMDAAVGLLAKEKQRLIEEGKMTVKDAVRFPAVPVTKGQYGSEAYWFLELRILDCATYGEESNTTCANAIEMEDKFTEGLITFAFVTTSQTSRTESRWKNIYRELELNRWNGIEAYFMKTHSFETDRFLHMTNVNHLNYTSYKTHELRTNVRKNNREYVTIYIRMHDEVVEEKLAHYSLLHMLIDVGGAWEVVVIFMTFGFVGVNFVIYRRNRQKRKRDQQKQK